MAFFVEAILLTPYLCCFLDLLSLLQTLSKTMARIGALSLFLLAAAIPSSFAAERGNLRGLQVRERSPCAFPVILPPSYTCNHVSPSPLSCPVLQLESTNGRLLAEAAAKTEADKARGE